MNKNILYFKKIKSIIVACLFILLASTSFAQKNIYKFSDKRSDNETLIKGIDKINANEVLSLTYNLNSSVYLNKNEIKTYGENPTNLYANLNSLDGLDNLKIQKDKIKMIEIKVENKNEMNSVFNSNLFSKYQNLKYIHIRFLIKASDKNIIDMTKNINEDYIIFYTIDLESAN